MKKKTVKKKRKGMMQVLYTLEPVKNNVVKVK